jgi:phosphoribosylglycinamide formyltransferase-1
MMQIAIFASGSGTNADNLIRYFQDHPTINVALVFANKPSAGVISRAYKYNVPVIVAGKKTLHSANYFQSLLEFHEIDFIVLAGFLWLVPEYLTAAYANRMVNIHPALLPNYGGKGMYGDKVHEAVVKNKETQTGITIHLVNDRYDEGDILFQAYCPVEEGDTPEQVANRVHALEYEHYPRVVEEMITKTTR